MKPCEWSDDPQYFHCKRCGFKLRRSAIEVLPYRRTCPSTAGPRGLGDVIARWIDRLVRRLRLRRPTGCGCGKRQATLNVLFPFSRAVWRMRLSFLWRLLRRR